MKKSRGITLIALVVTIVVLLILAGVSLNLISGSDGILGRATSAENTYDASSAKEQAELFITDTLTAYYEEVYVDGTFSGSRLDYINNQIGSGTVIGDYFIKVATSGIAKVEKIQAVASLNGAFATAETLTELNIEVYRGNSASGTKILEGTIDTNGNVSWSDEVSQNGTDKFSVQISKGSNIKSFSGNGLYSVGDSVTVTAVLKDNYIDTDFTYNPETAESLPEADDEKYLYEHTYEFSGWSGDLTSSELSFTFIMPEHNINLNIDAVETNTKKETYKYVVQEPSVPNTVFMYVESQDGRMAEQFNAYKGQTYNNYYGCTINFSNTGILQIVNTNTGTAKVEVGQIPYDIPAGDTLELDVSEGGASEWVKQ